MSNSALASFSEFSPKQLDVLTWWCRNSDKHRYDAIICDGAVRSGIVCVKNFYETTPVAYPQLVTLSVLNPDAGQLCGNSIMKGLPFVSNILMKIYNTIGINWERVGNVRFAVTYKPQNDVVDRAYAKDRAQQVAREWSEAMQSGNGKLCHCIVSLPQQIVDWLSSQDDMKDIKFFVEYPPVNKAVPLRRSIVAVGIENIEIVDKFVANDDGVLERQEYCRLAKIKANLSICVPFSMGGQTCHDIFTRIANALTFRTNLNILESGCVEIKSDRDTDALVMTGWFLMEADFCPAQSTDENFASFLDKELLCGSHIRNNVIHVTSEDKLKWNEPFVVGSYFGNGESSQTVNIGFKPSFVMVFVPGFPAVRVNFTSSTAKTYFAVALQDSTTGVVISSNGFRTQNSTAGGSSLALNELGISYNYIAFK